jgi:Ca2+-binding RTX toxin-like protein
MRSRVATALVLLCAMVLVGRSAWAIDTAGTNANDGNVAGTAGTDHLFGRAGKDTLNGNGGVDLLAPGSGKDTVNSTGGMVVDDDGKASRREKPDVLNGSPAVDLIFSADDEADSINCGADDDVAVGDVVDRYSGCEIVLTFSGETLATGAVYVAGTKSGEQIDGTGGREIIAGTNGDDQIAAGGDNDFLLGGKGTDQLDAGPGNDALFDDDSKPGDLLQGFDGADQFYSADGAVDTINCGFDDDDADTVYADSNDNVTNCSSGGDTVVLLP